MARRTVVLVAVVGGACFAAGIGVTRWSAAPDAAPPPASTAAVTAEPAPRPGDAGAVPRIVFDPEAIRLLPDASLRLDLPPPLAGDAPAVR